MGNDSTDINKVLQKSAPDPDFPCAPFEWTRDEAKRIASEEGLELTDMHWEVIRAMQRFYAHHENSPIITLPELNDALEEHFHSKGGVKYLYTLFPGGPIAQSCRLAGLKAPGGATVPGFGSVA